MEGRVFEMFLKNQKFSKFQKCPKSFPKVSKRVLNMFWGNFSEKIFLLSVPWRVESSKCFQKIKKIFKIPKKLKIVPKSVQTCFEHVLEYFFRNYFFLVFHRGSGLRNVFKKSNNFQIFQKCQKSFPNCPKVL